MLKQEFMRVLTGKTFYHIDIVVQHKKLQSEKCLMYAAFVEKASYVTLHL